MANPHRKASLVSASERSHDDLSDHELLTAPQTRSLLKISHATLYRELGRQRIEAVRIGNRLRFTGAEIKRYVRALPRFQSRDAAALQRLSSGAAE